MKKIYYFVFFIILFSAISTGSVLACTYHAYQQCSGNNLYWYDSCGNQQDLAQYCQYGCYNNSCQYNNYYNYNNYGNCTYHAYKLCVGNSIYWYSGCDQQQDLYYACPAGQVCNNPNQYGQCATPYIQPTPTPYPPYVVHYKTACYGNSLYWYDSLGVSTGLYKNCADNNSCTVDTCSGNSCLNTLNCDGSTCVTNSADYNKYCQLSQPNQSSQPATQNNADALSVSFFSKQDASSNQWQKTVQAGSNGQVFFLISIVNNSATQIDNVNVSANIPPEIAFLGNLQLNETPVSGDIVSGINIDSLPPTATKSITFEGKTQAISSPSTKQANATISASGATQSDSLSIDFVEAQAVTAAVSSSPATFSLGAFLKRWYMWLLAGLVLVIVVIVIIRRFSSTGA